MLYKLITWICDCVYSKNYTPLDFTLTYFELTMALANSVTLVLFMTMMTCEHVSAITEYAISNMTACSFKGGGYGITSRCLRNEVENSDKKGNLIAFKALLYNDVF